MRLRVSVIGLLVDDRRRGLRQRLRLLAHGPPDARPRRPRSRRRRPRRRSHRPILPRSSGPRAAGTSARRSPCRSTTRTHAPRRSRSRSSGDGPRIPAQRIGSLVINPGGPGEAGTQLLGRDLGVLTPTVKQRFDIVEMDPRGVGNSGGLHCSDPGTSGPASGTGAKVDPVPVTPEGRDRADRSRPRLRASVCPASRGAPRPHRHDRRRPRPGAAAQGARRRAPHVPRHLVRHAARRDVRGSLPDPRARAGARRRDRRRAAELRAVDGAGGRVPTAARRVLRRRARAAARGGRASRSRTRSTGSSNGSARSRFPPAAARSSA